MPNVRTLTWFTIRRLGLAARACEYNFAPIASYDIRRLRASPENSFLIAHWNAPQFVAQLLACIGRHNKRIPHEILVIDDVSGSRALRQPQRPREPDRITRFLSPGGHSRSLEWAFHRCRGEYVVILDQDALILTDHWLDLLNDFRTNPELLLIGVRDKVPGLRNSPQRHHASFMIMHRKRCLQKLGPLHFPPAADLSGHPHRPSRTLPSSHMQVLHIVAPNRRLSGGLSHQVRRLHGDLLSARQTTAGFESLVFRRLSDLHNSDRISGLLVADLRESQQGFHHNLSLNSLDLAPVR